MKSTKILSLAGLTFGIVLLFSQCKPVADAGGEIPYNKENAKVHIISVKTASQFTANFRRGKTALSRQLNNPEFLNNNFNLPLAEAFNRDAIVALLNQKGANGIRVYFGQDEKGQIRMVLVAVDKKGDDITGDDGNIMKFSSNVAAQEAIIIEAGQRCPTLCSLKGPLIN